VNIAAVKDALTKAVKPLNLYWQEQDKSGAWNWKIIQWHESGQYWDTYLNYRFLFKDSTYDSFIIPKYVPLSHTVPEI
jgi:hypothetical protein